MSKKQAHRDKKTDHHKQQKPEPQQAAMDAPLLPDLLLQRAEMGDALPPAAAAHLQRTIGNRALTRFAGSPVAAPAPGLTRAAGANKMVPFKEFPHRLLQNRQETADLKKGLVLQTKLMLGPAADRYEKEADQVAKRVVRQMESPSSAQRQEDEETLMTKRDVQRQEMEEEEILTKPLPTKPVATPIDPGVAASIQRARGGGQPLDTGLRQPLEETMGADFSGVKVHTNGEADHLNRALNARAFTTGQDIFFRKGHYRPHNSGGRELIAHELAHVVQQKGAGVLVQRSLYGTLPANDTRKAQIDAKAENDYYKKAAEFEKKLGFYAAKHPNAKAIADRMLTRVVQIVNAWADAANMKRDSAYEHEFSWGGAGFGAIPMVARDIKNVIEDKKGSVPLREKLTLVYSTVRNNNLAKWLRVAAQETLHPDQELKPKFRTGTGALQEATVKKGFAAQSGLDQVIRSNLAQVEPESGKTMQQIIADEAAAKGVNEQSDLLKWSQGVARRNKDREAILATKAHARRHLKAKEVDDLSARELRKNFAKDPSSRIMKSTKKKWSSSDKPMKFDPGGQWYRVKAESELANKARDIKARLVAGVSGSTDLMMHAGQWLGITQPADKRNLRLAMLGWMIPPNDHSWYEIMEAAKQYQVAYTEPPDGYGDIPPLDPTELKNLLPPMNGRKMLPGDYLKDDYKDHLLTTWLPASNVQVQGRNINEFVSAGVPRGLIEQWPSEKLQQIGALKQKVDAAQFAASGGDPTVQQHNQNAFDGLLQSTEFKTLQRVGGDPAKADTYSGKAELILAAFVQNRIAATGSDFQLPPPYNLMVQAAGVMKARADMQPGDKKLSASALQALPGRDIQWQTRGAGMQYTQNVQDYPGVNNPAALQNLHARERAGIYKYTKESYKGIVPALISLPVGDKQSFFDSMFSASLKDNMPQIMALTSGLEQLPVYQGTVYRVSSDYNVRAQFENLPVKTYEEQEAWLERWVDQRFPVGKVLSYSYPLSTGKSLETILNLNTTGSSANDVVFIIEKVKSGRDVQLLSANPGEEEVLFPPGARFVVKGYDHSLDVPVQGVRAGKENAPNTDAQKFVDFKRAQLQIFMEEI